MKELWKEISTVGSKIIDGGNISYDEAVNLGKAFGSDIFMLCGFAGKIKEKYTGNNVDLCSVINAKCGYCSEDCAFCSQSSYYNTNVECHPLLNEDELVEMAIQREKSGAKHCDIATSGLGYTGEEKDFQTILNAYKKIRNQTNLKMCACLGTLTKEAAHKLYDVGVERYSHNLQTSKSFFNKVVTTHSYDERINTIKYAKEVGMEVCSGMIIGMGESMEQRIEHMFLLKDLDVDAVPINVLSIIKGTKLENAKPLSPLEIIKTFAIARFILPDKNIRYAAGREKSLNSLQPLGFIAGLNGMLIGDCLTINGPKINKDFKMLEDLELTY